MATRNFYIKNANTYYVIAPTEDDGAWWFDDAIEGLQEVAASIGITPFYYDCTLREVDGRMNGNMRDYYAKPLRNCYEQDYADKFGNVWAVYMYPCLRSAYYEGACLDYYIKVVAPNGDELDNSDALDQLALGELVADYVEWSADYGDIFNENELQALGDKIQALVKAAADKFEELGEASGYEEYVLGGVFSSGEAVYINKSKLAERALKKED